MTNRVIRLSKLARRFNARYKTNVRVQTLTNAAKRLRIPIYKVTSQLPQGGRSSNGILVEDVAELETDYRSKLGAKPGRARRLVAGIVKLGYNQADVSRMTGIDEAIISKVMSNERNLNRGQVAQLKQLFDQLWEE
jgi:hypothetical protein